MARTGRIGVIGGGLGGLSAACVLAARGYSVTLFEKNPWLGGKAAVLEEAGYRFDMGPTILTIPSVLRRIFGEAGQRLEDALTLLPCDPQWRSFFGDGTSIDLVEELAAMKRNLEAFSPGSGKGYGDFLAWSKVLHDISERFFFWKSIGSLWDMFDLKSMFQPALLGDVMRMRMGKTVAESVRAYVPEPRLAQMIDHFTQYVGSAPDASPAVLCGIAHMQTQEGIWYPVGGTAAVPKALVKLGRELGVEYRTGVGVHRITHAGGAVTGVELDTGEQIECAAVVSNADSVRTHRELLSGRPSQRFEKRRSYEPACSGVVLYLGLDRAYEHLAHHNFVFSNDPHEEFEFIYRKGLPAPDPSCYLAAPARNEPSVAPPGGEALYVLVHTPYIRPGQDWKQMYPEYRKTILHKLATTGGMKDIESRIRFESFLTPQDIHDRYRVLDGAIYGLASHGRMFGAFKPANRSPDLTGLYLAGGAAHPGPGMPMVLMSGWIAADSLDKDGVVGKAVAPQAQRLQPLGFAPINSTMSQSLDAPRASVELPRRSAWRVKLFTRYFRRWMGKNFHALRVSKTGRPPDVSGKPMIVVVNHPAWWDPLMILVLAELFAGHEHYAPMDATALKRYRLFEPLGCFGVDVGTTAGALTFLRTSTAILGGASNALWITAQGKFCDPRVRPVELRAGVGHLIRRLNDVVVVPLAIEYPFWQERYPEALAHFGRPIEVGRGRDLTVEAWMGRIEAGLTQALDDLSAAAQTQDAGRFDALVGGNVGVGGVYDLWRRVKGLIGGPSFVPGHAEAVRLSLKSGGER